jgi:hypothetical protein
MHAAPFAAIDHLGSELVPAGQSAVTWVPGDFLLTHGDAFFSKIIRFGEGLRIRGADRPYTWFNHAALVIDDQGNLAEALGAGVVRSHADKYLAKDYVVVHSGASPGDVTEILGFADWVLATRCRYGWLTIVSLALTMLTGAKLTFFVDGEFICSGFVARAMERTGAVFSRDPVHITPADLAKYYDARPPNAASAEPLS